MTFELLFSQGKKEVIGLPCLPTELKPVLEERKLAKPCSGTNLLKTSEAEAIQYALAQHNGHREKTAKALGIHKTTLIRKMKKLGMIYL